MMVYLLIGGLAIFVLLFAIDRRTRKNLGVLAPTFFGLLAFLSYLVWPVVNR